MKKYLFKIILSLVFIIISFSCFHFPPKRYTQTVKISEEKTLVQEFNNESKLFEWIGLLFLALSVWIWRKELNLTSIGPISGPAIVEQRKAEEVFLELKKDEQIQNKEISVDYDFQKDRKDQFKKRILEIAKERRVIDPSIVSHDLAVTRTTAQHYLYLLTKEGELRQDGFPSSTYTLANSIENLAIDKLKTELEKKGEILSERRFVKVQRRYEVDALLKNKDQTFLIELKFMKSRFSQNLLSIAYTQLIATAKALKETNMELYLVIVTPTKELKNDFKKIVKNYTFDSERYPFIIVVYAAEDL